MQVFVVKMRIYTIFMVQTHMKKIIFLFLFITALGQVSAQSVFSAFRDGQLYVQVNPAAIKNCMGLNPRKLRAADFPFLSRLISTYQITRITRPFAEASDDALLPYVLRLEFNAIWQVAALEEELIKTTEVRFCEKVPLMKTDIVPNEGLPIHLAQVNAANAWNVFNGNSTITIAIIDNAVMWTHADLVQNTYTNTAEIAGNSVDDDNNGYVDDVNGWDATDWDNNPIPTQTGMSHGTHCAGIAAGRTNNGIGIASIGWNLKMIPVKCQTDNGSTTIVANGYEGIIYAAKARARIISCSWGGSGASSTEQAIVNYAWNKGCLIFASAGNANTSAQNYPGAYANVYCVSAVNTSDVKSSYSNFGSWVDIAAPGDNINSTVPYTGATAAYNQSSGTSMATPLVAGLAGLMLSKSPLMTRANVLNCISTTAANIYSLTGNASYVTNNQLGAGRIDAYAAMLCASTFSALPPAANFTAFPRMTCPLTAVQFNDSSLYLPTAWSWTFQSGTPSTSTSSNPSVSWASPGTYSVAMNCSNAFGASAVVTKTAYITVAGPLSLPFVEGFENATFLPANWSAKNIDNDQLFWARRTSLGGFGTSTACAIFDNFNLNVANERDEMRSPKFSFSNVSSARLRFDVAYARYNATYSDSLEVRLSTNCGSSWSSIYLKGGTQLSTTSDLTSLFVPTNTQWRRDSIDITALTAGQTNVMFAFVNRGHWGQPIYLDNINLAFPSPSLQVTHPASVCVNSAVSFSNASVGATSYSWNFSGAASASSTNSNATVTYSAPGIYTVLIQAANGSNSVSLTRTVSVSSYPSVAAGSFTICSGTGVGLLASGASNYTWSTSAGSVATGALYNVTPSVSTVYTVSGVNGVCSGTATASISVNISPTVTAANASICPNASVALSANGASTFSWSTGSTNSVISVSPSTTTIYTVTGYNGLCSNTRTVSVSVNAVPILTTSISSPSVCIGGTVLLTASGALNYTWTTGANSASFVMVVNSAIVLGVTGSNGICQSTRTLSITPIAPPSLSITSTANSTVCAGTTVSLAVFGANTYTWLPSGILGQQNTVVMNSNTTFTALGANSGCTRSQSVAIYVWPAISLTVSPANPSVCAGQNLSLSVSGANTYSWSGGFIGPVYSFSLTNTANLMVTGFRNGCTKTATIPVIVAAVPQVSLNTAAATCYSLCNGSFTANVSSGNWPYSYSLNAGCSQSLCSNLCAGLYTLQVSDLKGCRSKSSFSISEPAALSTSLSVTSPACGNCNTGSITVQVNGGTPVYSYSWSPTVSTGSVAMNLQNGCYTVQVRDVKACETSTVVCLLNTTGTEALELEGLSRIYPNPTQQTFFIETTKYLNYQLFSLTGQLIQKGHCLPGLTQVPVEGFAVGIYILKLSGETSEVFRKILIE